MWYLPYLIYFYCMTVEKKKDFHLFGPVRSLITLTTCCQGREGWMATTIITIFKGLVFCLFDENRAPVLPSFIENVLQKGYINTKINALKPLKLCSRHATLQFSAFLGWPHIVLFSHLRIIWACFRHL